MTKKIEKHDEIVDAAPAAKAAEPTASELTQRIIFQSAAILDIILHVQHANYHPSLALAEKKLLEAQALAGDALRTFQPEVATASE